MVIIEVLPTDTVTYKQAIESVSHIEGIIQSQDAWTDEAISKLLEQDSVKLMIATESADNDVVVGYCLYQVIFEQAEIFRIGTHLDYQRQGIASQLFVSLNTKLQTCGVESLLLEVRADNIPAITLYEQQGFKIIHRRKGYYQQLPAPAIDALIMQRVYSR